MIFHTRTTMTQQAHDVEFPTYDGLKLRGYFFSAGDNRPCIIMTHGFGGRKETFLPDFAARFQQATYGVLIYDNRNWGQSEGQPRNEVDPALHMRDYSDAFDFAASLPDVDASKIVYWGTSMSGGTSICAAAIDKRIKGVIAQGLFVSGQFVAERTVSKHPLIFGNRAAVKSGQAPIMIPISAESVEEIESGESQAVLQDPGIFSYQREQLARGLTREKEVTLNSLFNMMSFDPRAQIHRISPTPLLMVLAEDDKVIKTERQLAMYEMAQEPKQLHVIKGAGHFGMYYGELFEDNIQAQLKFLKDIL